MKILIYIFGIILISAGCNVLDVEPTDSIPASSAFKDKAGIERGIVGSYSSLQSLSYYGRAFITYGDLAADNLEHPVDATNADYGEIDNNNILPENGAIGGTWAVIYDGINVANNVIVKVPGMSDMTESEKNMALGELYFLRALNHFNLANYFGAIPIKIQPTIGVGELDAGRDPLDMIYTQIIDDLKFAEQNLTSSVSNKIRASRFAATALLARLYLYHGDYDLAWEKANDVITGGGYTLLENFADVFLNDGSAETIFEIDFIETDRNRIAEYNFPKTLNGRREVAPTIDIISAFETGDERKDVSVAFDGVNAYANKYNDLSNGADNIVVLRLAEMFLIRAEAELNKTNPDLVSVKDDIDTIRSRANLNPTSENTVENLLMVIEKERRAEFVFEGQRWLDLVRTGRVMDVIPTVTSVNKTLYPIPLSEIQTNKSPEMIQNPGYN